MATTDDYVLDRGYAAASRLNYQFYLWKKTLNFNLHPSNPAPHADAVIADIATGTGIWLLDLASELPPTVQFEGMDITLSQAPPKQWLPSNTSLRTWNIFDDVPTELRGKFDIVHIRLVLLVLPNNDAAAPLIRRLVSLLKPGGHLQWDEQSGFAHRVLAAESSSPTSALQQMHKLLDGHGRFEWTIRLDTLMMENGLENAALHQYDDPVELAKFHNDMLLMMLEEFAAGVAMSKGKEEAARMQQLIQAIYRESQEGAAMSVPKIVCVGRKKME